MNCCLVFMSKCRLPFSISRPLAVGLNRLNSCFSQELSASIALVNSGTSQTFFDRQAYPFEMRKVVSTFSSMSLRPRRVLISYFDRISPLPSRTATNLVRSSSQNAYLVLNILPSLRDTIFFFIALPKPTLYYSLSCCSTVSRGVPYTVDSWQILASGVPRSAQSWPSGVSTNLVTFLFYRRMQLMATRLTSSAQSGSYARCSCVCSLPESRTYVSVSWVKMVCWVSSAYIFVDLIYSQILLSKSVLI